MEEWSSTVLDHLEALFALAEAGTMTGAATRLRITQSAVSKRIAALEERLDRPLVEPDGRKVRLTPEATRLLERAYPIVTELRLALGEPPEETGGRVAIGVSESILASWGAAALARVQRRIPGLQLDINAHRSPVVIERVRSGEYLLGLCAGLTAGAADLRSVEVLEEPMVIVPRQLQSLRLRRGASVPILTIERGSATWASLERRLREVTRVSGVRFEVTDTVQSFSSATQMARAGFAHALVPRAVARSHGIAVSKLVAVPRPGLSRPVRLLGRTSTFGRQVVQAIERELLDAVPG